MSDQGLMRQFGQLLHAFQPLIEASQQTAQQSLQQTAEQPSQQSSQQTAEQPSQQSSQQTAEQPSQQSSQQTAERSGRRGRQIFSPRRLRLPSISHSRSNQTAAHGPIHTRNHVTPLNNLTTTNSEDEFEDLGQCHGTIMPVLRRKKRTRTVTRPIDDQVAKRKGRVVTKDVLILAHNSVTADDGTYAVPNSSEIARLVTKRMAGKISFHTTDSEATIREEIASLFGTFAFKYLQILPGNRKLTQPFVSKSVVFDASTLLSMSPQGRLYVLAEEPVPSSIQDTSFSGHSAQHGPSSGQPSAPPDQLSVSHDLPSLPPCLQPALSGQLSASNDLPSVPPCPLSALPGRQICSEGHTVGRTGYCIICDQNQQFQESMATDRLRQTQQEAVAAKEEQQAQFLQAQQKEMARIREERAARLPDEPHDGFLIRVRNTSGQDCTRKFNADQDIQVLMDFIGSQPTSTQLFAVRESSRESPALDSTLKGLSLSHYGLTRPVVLHVYWLSDSEAGNLQHSEEQEDLQITNSSAPTSIEEQLTSDDSDDEHLIIPDRSLELPTSPLAQLIQKCNSRLTGPVPIHIMRDAAIDSMLDEVKRLENGTSFSVVFVSEEGQDGGGLIRELNSLILQEWSSSVLSSSSGRGFSIDATSLDGGDFKTLGRYVGTTIAQGTVGLPVFSSPLARYIITSSLGDVEPKHFDTTEQTELAKKLMSCSLQDVDEVIDRPTIGCSKPITVLSEADRSRWMRGLFRRDVLLHQLNAIIDFQAGLQPMLDIWKSTPENVELAIQFLLQDSIQDLTEAAFLELFRLNRYGTEGSQLYRDETRAYYWFESFLKDVHRGLATCKNETQREDFQPPLEDISITVGDVLMFFTGSMTMPPSGFSSAIMIHFDRECTLPKVSTCALNATMPLNATATNRKG